jgi:predicted HicB family RNase H-like nuclease
LNQKDNLINLKKANDDLNNKYDSIYHEYQNFIINTVNNVETVITRWEKDIEDLKQEDTLNFTAYLEAQYKKTHNEKQ